jgi:hypothetical protein
MTVSVVNGFVCYSSCDVSKAKQGKDPHPSTGPADVDQEAGASSPGRADQPAVVFGGSLLRTSEADAVNPVAGAQSTDPTTLSRSKFSVDLLV